MRGWLPLGNEAQVGDLVVGVEAPFKLIGEAFPLPEYIDNGRTAERLLEMGEDGRSGHRLHLLQLTTGGNVKILQQKTKTPTTLIHPYETRKHSLSCLHSTFNVHFTDSFSFSRQTPVFPLVFYTYQVQKSTVQPSWLHALPTWLDHSSAVPVTGTPLTR